jgi:transposase InsO family protein
MDTLDKKMESILEREDLSTDERFKLYDQSFTRYLNVHDDYRPRPVVSRVSTSPPAEHRELANDNRVPPLLDRTPQKHQETEGKKSRTGSTLKTEVETTKGAVVNMESTYYNVVASASYGGLSKFKPKGYTKKEVREWLQSQDTHTLHKPTRRIFTRRCVVVYRIDHQWQADLVDLAKLSSYNKGFKYLLTCIDVLSRYAWVVPLKDKTGKTLKDAFQVIFKSGRRPIRLQTDKGTEFTNRVFQRFLKEHDVHFFTTYN